MGDNFLLVVAVRVQVYKASFFSRSRTNRHVFPLSLPYKTFTFKDTSCRSLLVVIRAGN